MCFKKLINKKQKNLSKNKKDVGMAYYTLPLKKVKKQEEMPLPSLGPIYIFSMGCDLAWVMAFPLVSSLF